MNTPSASDAVPVLEVEDLVVKVRTGSQLVTLVDGVSYAVMPAEALALVGESGAGKSIGVRAALNLLNHRKFQVSGRISIDGVDLSTLSNTDRKKLITKTTSLVFQDPLRSLNPSMRVGWQVAEAMHAAKSRSGQRKKSEARVRAVELLRLVGIADPEQRFFAYPHELSGGMRQRIVIAIALSCEPKIIFCDEPTTSLDVTTQAQIMDLLDELREQFSISVVLITHDLALAASRVDRVMVMYSGKIVEKIAAAKISERVSMPYARALLRAVPGADVDGKIPEPIPGSPPDPRFHLPGCAFHPRCDRVQETCLTDMPKLEEKDFGHFVRCWNPVVDGDRATEPAILEMHP